ncbi:beta-1,3-galactosyltransferase 2-like [Egretta garzetta]|uniref:beta-1,3-galactosyltransferase 2-like n=1 Tax=Egretta garzetta TaxID=188379 RepID=UPI00051F08F0|nr:beta-1,3-galactosyltransferase 2-like [Egretta garzetta]
MTYCSGLFSSPWDCTKRNVLLIASISFTVIHLILYFLNSDHLAVLIESEVQTSDDLEEKDTLFTKRHDNLQMKSDNIVHKTIISNSKQFLWEKNGELPAENEKFGNKTRSTSTQSFKFIINEKEKCKDKTPFLVLLIATTAAEIQRRSSIRNTWGNESVVPGAQVVRLFMLGIESKGPDEVLLRESEQYHDIIQQDFLDTYHNLTLKTLMGMRWVASYCSATSFVMKTDSDVFVNTIYLIEKLLRPLVPPPKNYFTGCLMKGHKPIRNKNNKWYISKEEYPGDRFPPFCSGTGYIFSGDLASKIVSASVMIKFIHLEDVYIGLCLNAEGIQIVPPPSHSLFNIYKVPFSPCRYNNIITSHYIQTNEHVVYWETLRKDHTCQTGKEGV